MPATDKPTTHFTFAQFEDSDTEPFVFGAKGSKRITFPHPLDLDMEQLEKVEAAANRGQIRESFRLWLGDDDYKKLAGDLTKARQYVQLLEAVQKHYETYFGTSGEGTASAS